MSGALSLKPLRSFCIRASLLVLVVDTASDMANAVAIHLLAEMAEVFPTCCCALFMSGHVFSSEEALVSHPKPSKT